MQRLVPALLALLIYVPVTAAAAVNLCTNGDFRQVKGTAPIGYTLTGAAEYGYLGDPGTSNTAYGVRLDSSKPAGSVSQNLAVDTRQGKWFRFTFHGLPQTNFAVADDALEMKVQFLGADGKTQYDGKSRRIYPLITKARQDLTVNGDNHRDGAEVWQTYTLDFVVPFEQVRQFELSVDFKNGSGHGSRAKLLVSDFSVVALPDTAPTSRPAAAVVPAYDHLIPLGGRWYWAAATADVTAPPKTIDTSNADRLLYHDSGYSAPFANNTVAWLRKGNEDVAGNTAAADKLVTDNVTISVEQSSLVVHTHGLPNHPTGNFPGENPNSIREQDSTYYLPLNPQVNPKHVSTAVDNSNHALNMGPIGLAVNGVVFFNPFDAGSQDASNIMDRCCGHPNPDGQYHYHKYPVCVNSPWADEGKGHSPLIGFAFDGFPIYGPYESTDVMAKDLTGDKKLNEFNLHFDPERGWHYHVTPGQFPYMIGGYWGVVDSRDVSNGPPHGGGPQGGPPQGNRRRRPPPPGF